MKPTPEPIDAQAAEKTVLRYAAELYALAAWEDTTDQARAYLNAAALRLTETPIPTNQKGQDV